VGIGEIVPNTGGDIYDTTNVDVSYPGGCLDNIQQFEVWPSGSLSVSIWLTQP
jgi:hypothetical protein